MYETNRIIGIIEYFFNLKIKREINLRTKFKYKF